MNESVLQAIKTLEDLRFTKPADEERVSAAERQLGLNFAVDYKAYVRTYGVISAKGIELTGLTEIKRLDVVSVTKRERETNPFFPGNMYVIENIGIDGVLFLQNSEGEIYKFEQSGAIQKKFHSLEEYIKHVVSNMKKSR